MTEIEKTLSLLMGRVIVLEHFALMNSAYLIFRSPQEERDFKFFQESLERRLQELEDLGDLPSTVRHDARVLAEVMIQTLREHIQDLRDSYGEGLPWRPPEAG